MLTQSLGVVKQHSGKSQIEEDADEVENEIDSERENKWEKKKERERERDEHEQVSLSHVACRTGLVISTEQGSIHYLFLLLFSSEQQINRVYLFGLMW